MTHNQFVDRLMLAFTLFAIGVGLFILNLTL